MKQTNEEKIEKHIKEQHENELKTLMEEDTMGLISVPTVNYNIGDRVEYGRHYLTKISDILNDGKILELEIQVNKKDSEKFLHFDKRYVSWIEVVPYSDKQKENFSVSENYITFVSFSNTHFSTILCYFYHFGLDLDVIYQRGYVWNLDQKIELIDSIFNNVPIGFFILNHRKFKYLEKNYEVIDGKQRISTIIDFIEGRFKYKNTYYRDLSKWDRCVIRDYSISICTLNELKESEKMEVFIKFNKCGTPQSSEHLSLVEKMMEEYKKEGR